MADSINLKIDEWIREYFNVGDVDVRTYSPLVYAYIGDCIYDLVIRTLAVCHGNTKMESLHKYTTSVVRATAQSQMLEDIGPLLTEEEEDIVRRGRNAKSASGAKNASMMDYRRATALEALIGYLYLTDRMDRVLELIKVGLEKEEFEW